MGSIGKSRSTLEQFCIDRRARLESMAHEIQKQIALPREQHLGRT